MRARHLLAAPLLGATLALASRGAYPLTKHGDALKGVQRPGLLDARGECAHCHDQHASRDGVSNGGPYPWLLFTSDSSTLCFTCHTSPGANLIYPGQTLFNQSVHALSPSLVWPGPVPPARSSSEAGKCINCHDPHGRKDGAGLIPSMNLVREEGLCNTCHDGSPAQKDVRSDFLKPFRHPVERTGLHDEAEESGGFANRHSECVDCHNPHQVREDAIPPAAPNASNRLLGVGRVKVTNGSAGTRPVYTWVGPEDFAFAREYELCFKCHSTFTTQPGGQSDLAVRLNPANPSFHPVEAAGTNPGIPVAGFTPTWTASSLVYCTDCHSSDGSNARGPHGSNYRYLLKKAYAASPLPQAMASTDLCFDCHNWDTYANPGAAGSTLQASRFNPPQSANGHAYHVGSQSITCYTCHETHGSTLYRGLVAVGRSPGLTSYVQSPTGGTCTSTCHASRAYTANYGR